MAAQFDQLEEIDASGGDNSMMNPYGQNYQGKTLRQTKVNNQHDESILS